MAPRWDGARRRFSVVPTTPRGYGATSLGAVHGMAGPMAADAGGDGADPSLPPYAAQLRTLMADALARGGSIRVAAAEIGMPKSTFADKARAWGLLDERRRRAGG